MRIQPLIITLILIAVMGFCNSIVFGASKIVELKTRIDQKNNNIKELEQVIEEYKQQLAKVSVEKQSLNNEIYRLNLSRKKLSSSLNLIDNKIESTRLNIEKLKIGINNKEIKISNNMASLAKTIKLINELDANSLVEMLLSNKNLSGFFSDVETLQKFQSGIRKKVKELRGLKKNLEINREQTEEKKRELINYRSELADQKKIIEFNKKEKNKLLKSTKNKEVNYKKILKRKQRLRAELEKEISDLESQLKIEIDPNTIPSSAYGVLHWPVKKVHITQYFGKTFFSTKNSQIYRGKGHTGVDFRASVGTKVRAALSGIVTGIGNTDTVPPRCFSYGKWVLIKHSNGLSTLYAHLSLIKVKSKQTVNTGEVIGYSGNTGYATGPHLHFGVYATKGVRITKFTKSINCKNKYIPLAPYDAYLNPLSYLPKYK